MKPAAEEKILKVITRAAFIRGIYRNPALGEEKVKAVILQKIHADEISRVRILPGQASEWDVILHDGAKLDPRQSYQFIAVPGEDARRAALPNTVKR
jgi:hypothetical protein